jgi:hypothetical protein
MSSSSHKALACIMFVAFMGSLLIPTYGGLDSCLVAWRKGTSVCRSPGCFEPTAGSVQYQSKTGDKVLSMGYCRKHLLDPPQTELSNSWGGPAVRSVPSR